MYNFDKQFRVFKHWTGFSKNAYVHFFRIRTKNKLCTVVSLLTHCKQCMICNFAQRFALMRILSKNISNIYKKLMQGIFYDKNYIKP